LAADADDLTYCGLHDCSGDLFAPEVGYSRWTIAIQHLVREGTLRSSHFLEAAGIDKDAGNRGDSALEQAGCPVVSVTNEASLSIPNHLEVTGPMKTSSECQPYGNSSPTCREPEGLCDRLRVACRN